MENSFDHAHMEKKSACRDEAGTFVLFVSLSGARFGVHVALQGAPAYVRFSFLHQTACFYGGQYWI
jgi:hypothetical protein